MFVDAWFRLHSQIRIGHGCPRGSAIWYMNLWMSTLHFQISTLIGVYGNHPDDIWDGVCLCLCPPYVWYTWIFLNILNLCVANKKTISTWIIVDAMSMDWSVTLSTSTSNAYHFFTTVNLVILTCVKWINHCNILEFKYISYLEISTLQLFKNLSNLAIEFWNFNWSQYKSCLEINFKKF